MLDIEYKDPLPHPHSFSFTLWVLLCRFIKKNYQSHPTFYMIWYDMIWYYDDMTKNYTKNFWYLCGIKICHISYFTFVWYKNLSYFVFRISYFVFRISYFIFHISYFICRRMWFSCIPPFSRIQSSFVFIQIYSLF